MTSETTAPAVTEIDKMLSDMEASARSSLASLETAILDRTATLEKLNKVGVSEAAEMIANTIKISLQEARKKMISGCSGAARLNGHAETPDLSSLHSEGRIKWREQSTPELVLQPFRFLEPLDVLAILMDDTAIENFAKEAAVAAGCQANRPSPEQLHKQAVEVAADLELLVGQRNDLRARMSSLLVGRPGELKPSTEPQNFGNFVVLPEDPNRPTPRVIITGN